MRRSKPPSSDHTLRGRQIPELRVQVGSDLKAHTAFENVPRTREHVAGSGMAVKKEETVRVKIRSQKCRFFEVVTIDGYME